MILDLFIMSTSMTLAFLVYNIHIVLVVVMLAVVINISMACIYFLLKVKLINQLSLLDFTFYICALHFIRGSVFLWFVDQGI